MEAQDILHGICRLWILFRNRSYSAIQKQIIRKRMFKLYLLYIIIKRRNRERKRNKRRHWVRPIFSEEKRLMQGASDNLVREMEVIDKEKYFNYFRMPLETFEKLLSIIEPYITKETVIRTPIPARTRLQVTLRYLASGDSMTSISLFVLRIILFPKLSPKLATLFGILLKTKYFYNRVQLTGKTSQKALKIFVSSTTVLGLLMENMLYR